MVNIFSNSLRFLMIGVLVVQLTGCGTLLHPERKGQTGGKIDAGIALLDGIGLFFFLVPGIIAFAVDFNNGTIYLPGTRSGSLDANTLKEVKFDPKNTNLAKIENIIKAETGHAVALNQGNVQVTRLKSVKDLSERFAQAEESNNRLSLVR
jgi:copper chaperone CopZ